MAWCNWPARPSLCPKRLPCPAPPWTVSQQPLKCLRIGHKLPVLASRPPLPPPLDCGVSTPPPLPTELMGRRLRERERERKKERKIDLSPSRLATHFSNSRSFPVSYFPLLLTYSPIHTHSPSHIQHLPIYLSIYLYRPTYLTWLPRQRFQEDVRCCCCTARPPSLPSPHLTSPVSGVVGCM
ncbi:hypothetical protein LX32DRAFT_391415 [Colletotrichum zoysiae]|uniref:Uncharacterized protein n=1 Tax=Colletotrichum zoysiae TaxID=1216348 RepID=A0AAD9HIM2_9PEZI|nr:hypothetical protein LX32DRAFT_391415 [Colletotrichum zoysiae]